MISKRFSRFIKLSSPRTVSSKRQTAKNVYEHEKLSKNTHGWAISVFVPWLCCMLWSAFKNQFIFLPITVLFIVPEKNYHTNLMNYVFLLCLLNPVNFGRLPLAILICVRIPLLRLSSLFICLLQEMLVYEIWRWKLKEKFFSSFYNYYHDF